MAVLDMATLRKRRHCDHRNAGPRTEEIDRLDENPEGFVTFAGFTCQ